MKRTISIILSVLMLISLTVTGCAEAETQSDETTEVILQIGNPVMTVNGMKKPIDENGTAPVIINDRTLVPIRAIIEAMGGSVGWEQETRTVTLNYDEDEIRLAINSETAYLNGAAQMLDTAPTIINDRTMLPIRFIAESFSFEVVWNNAEKKVIIAKPTVKSADVRADNEAEGNKMLVVYFSCTGSTEVLAQTITRTTGADIYEIVPEVPYTSEDLNYNNDSCRANREMNDESARPAISGSIENIDDYDTIFLGYPIWWGTMPRIINTFLDTYDLSGKTVMPFCTSGGSGIGTSVSAIESICADADVKDGFRGSPSSSASQIESWLENNIGK